MATKAGLERRLSAVAGFERPTAALEQYATPADLAAHVLHLADLRGDLGGRTVVDLGAGTGMLALGAALRGATRVVGLEIDPGALATARANRARVDPAAPVAWVRADATRPPLATAPAATTVVTNPPFGAQTGNAGADRAFLGAAADLADVSYSVHNEGSRSFVEAFAADEGGRVTEAYAATLSVERQFEFHERDRAALPVEVYRIEWTERPREASGYRPR
jgi:putative methylase